MSKTSTVLFNRITSRQEVVEHVIPILGLYTLSRPTVINGSACNSGDYLCPLPVGSGSINCGDATLNLSAARLPSERERDAIKGLMADLIYETDARSWWYLVVCPVFFPAQNPEELKLRPVEQYLQQYLIHVQTVNRHPRTHLQTEIERTSITQARRIPSRAYQHLSAHTEDWAYQRFSNVVPRRILSITTEDYYRIYENMIAASLTVHLYRDLKEHERELSNILAVLRSDGNYTPGHGHYRKLNRQYNLLGELLELIENPTETLQHAMEQIAAMRQQLGALAGETLIRQIPEAHHLSLPASLRTTNIFVNDKHYRYIRLLWEKRQKQRIRKSPEQIQHEWQELHRAYEVFCLTLLVRALDTMHLSPADEHDDLPIVRGFQLLLKHKMCPQIAIEICYADHGVFEIIMHETVLAQIVPLLEPLAKDSLTATERFKSIDRMIQTQQIPTFVLYPGTNHELEQLTGEARKLACDLGNNGKGHKQQQAGFVPISPNELDSIERVGRALRLIIWSKLFASYPIQVEVPIQLRANMAEQASDWLRHHDGTLYLTNMDKAGNLNNLYRWIRKLRNNQGAPAFSENDREDFKIRLDATFAELKAIAHCPVCGVDCSHAFSPRHGSGFYFTCRCNGCGVKWGTDDCGSCHQPIPFIEFDHSEVKHTTTDWISATYGMDILSIPTGDRGHFICPNCKQDN